MGEANDKEEEILKQITETSKQKQKQTQLTSLLFSANIGCLLGYFKNKTNTQASITSSVLIQFIEGEKLA